MMDYQENDSSPDELIETICVACDLTYPVNNLSLCEACFAKLERDLIRARDWEYSLTAFTVAPDKLEVLRKNVIHDYGTDYELIESPETAEMLKRKNNRSKSRASQHKREIAAQAIRDYNTNDVVGTACDFIRAQNEAWVNVSRVSQYLYETFYHLKPKRLGQSGKKYKSLLKFVMDYPSIFEVQQDPADKQLVYWIRLV